jgi:hypothetical protein
VSGHVGKVIHVRLDHHTIQSPLDLAPALVKRELEIGRLQPRFLEACGGAGMKNRRQQLGREQSGLGGPGDFGQQIGPGPGKDAVRGRWTVPGQLHDVIEGFAGPQRCLLQRGHQVEQAGERGRLLLEQFLVWPAIQQLQPPHSGGGQPVPHRSPELERPVSRQHHEVQRGQPPGLQPDAGDPGAQTAWRRHHDAVVIAKIAVARHAVEVDGRPVMIARRDDSPATVDQADENALRPGQRLARAVEKIHHQGRSRAGHFAPRLLDGTRPLTVVSL